MVVSSGESQIPASASEPAQALKPVQQVRALTNVTHGHDS